MIRLLNRLLRHHETGEAVALARYYNRLGVACARKSIAPCDGWQAAARRHWAVRDARMWEARELAGLSRRSIRPLLSPALPR